MSEHLWLLFSALLVFLMQAGFLCLESGRTRSKNSINVAAKNISDFILSSAVFWLFGFALLFGNTHLGIIGKSEFAFGEASSPYQIIFFLFQMMFCGTAATLTSGAVAERATFTGYLLVTILLSGFIYPITGHWAWAGAYIAGNNGWLQDMGFVDFAGSTVVHSVGGWVALAAVLIIGPRIGRFDALKSMSQGSNLPMASLGTLLIWFGWFGFNGGSTLAFTDQVPKILLNTCLSATWGGIAAATLSYFHQRYTDVTYSLNGIVAGLVGITASCHAVSPLDASLIGVVSGLVVYYGTHWMERLRIDDAVAVIPAHLLAGIWGTLAVALFGSPERLATGLGFWQQLTAQIVGITAIGAYAFSVSYFVMLLINRYIPLRVSASDEMRGLNIAEHNATTELIDLLSAMETQQGGGDFASPVAEEPFTEVGQIAKKYNQVIARVNREIEQRDSAIVQFRASEQRKTAILDSSMDCIITIDRAGKIIEFNPASERTFGCLKKQVRGENFIDHFILPSDQEQVRSSLRYMFSASHGLVLNRRNSLSLRRSSTHPFPAEITITNTRLQDDASSEFTLHIRDVSRQVKMQKRLRFLAYSDPLTSLSNRTFLLEKLNQALKTVQSKGGSVALLFLDLDKFKKVNDTLGHKAGDELLCEVANRLTEISRDSDIIARWGGDEFILMLAGDLNEELLREKADTILNVMRRPIEINSKKFNLPTSIGVVLSQTGETTSEKMIQQADIAMYWAKQRGRDTYQLFTPEMAVQAGKSFRYEQDMQIAMTQNQFQLVYQPKVLQKQGTVIGLEALIRWHHPQDGNISPADFIPIAEESNLIIQIGEWVIENTLKQLSSWRDNDLEIVPVAINISGRHLVSDELIPFLSSQLKRHQIEGRCLEIEITEGVLLQDIERCIQVMTELKGMGIQLSIDDFGIGYSSLNYLKQLPIDTLKIDQSFVEDCDTSAEDAQICTTIINLANNLGLTTVAEGVEKQAQWQFLQSLGCEIFQGYYFYRPQQAADIPDLLASRPVVSG